MTSQIVDLTHDDDTWLYTRTFKERDTRPITVIDLTEDDKTSSECKRYQAPNHLRQEFILRKRQRLEEQKELEHIAIVQLMQLCN
jgi:hypothetical protein